MSMTKRDVVHPPSAVAGITVVPNPLALPFAPSGVGHGTLAVAVPGLDVVVGGGSPAERLRRAQGQIAALKERIAGLRKAKEDDIDWEALGLPSSEYTGRDGTPMPSPPTFAFNIRRSLRGHFGKIYAADWAGDNITVASAGQDGRLIIWNAFTENKRNLIALRSAWAMACATEKEEGRLVATGGLDNVASVHDVTKSGVGMDSPPVHTLVGHDGYISDLKFLRLGGGGSSGGGGGHGGSGGGDALLTASGDGTIGLWDLHTGARRATLGDHARDVMGLSVHPHDPNLLASASCDATVRIWDLRLAHSVLSFTGHVSDVNAVDFFPSGYAVASGSDDSSVRLFDLRSAGAINVLAEDRLLCGVTDVAFSRSGRLLFASYEEPFVIAWEVASRDGCVNGDRGGGRGAGYPTRTLARSLARRSHLPLTPIFLPDHLLQHLPRAQGPLEPHLVRGREHLWQRAAHGQLGHGALRVVVRGTGKGGSRRRTVCG
jgi:guanine nucleotide-binding protein G(I)/G(S)/G(T) subunit beta-1